MMRERLRRAYLAQTFNPSLAGMFFNPFYHARKGLYHAIAKLADRIQGKVLDVGCGQKPYEHLFKCEQYVGLEYDTEKNRRGKNADFFYDGGVFPFSDGEFDSVICNQVLEHVFNPDEFVREINRVMKPGGTLLLTVPFVWDEHEQPFDYARYSSFGISALIERNGLMVDRLVKTNLGVLAIAQLGAAYLYGITRTSRFAFNIAADVLIIAPVIIAGAVLNKCLPMGRDIYLDNVVLATKTRVQP